MNASATWIATPEDIGAWAPSAVAGDEMVYARAVTCAGSRAAIEARRLFDLGLVSLHARRQGGRLTYLMRKRVVAAAVVSPARISAKKMLGDDARVYRLLCDLATARFGDPGNAAIARKLQLPSAQSASYRIYRLTDMGKIDVVWDRVERVRKITIVLTGKSILGATP